MSLETEKSSLCESAEKRCTVWALMADEMQECQWLNPRLVAQIVKLAAL